MKTTRREELVLEFKGKAYRGSRVIEGTRKLFQTINYNLSSRVDGRAYKPSEEAYMEGMAKIILRELIEESLKA